ncbi:MAG: 23S rRNA (guanosine(2251)-2'-O)-methyltransferase RlmB [Nitrospinales bacterium]
MKNKSSSFIHGVHPILEALKSRNRHCHKIIVDEGKHNPAIRSILEVCEARGIRVESINKNVFRKKYGTGSSQGIIGQFSSKEILDIDEMIVQAYKKNSLPTLVMLDGIQDPQNMGAIIRSAEVLGIQGIIIPKRRTAPINETVTKCSAGAVETLPIATIENFSQTIEELKKAKFWVVGVDMSGDQHCGQFQFDMPTVLVIGGEEKGIRPLIKKSCDFTVSIPMEGQINSLNVAAAGAILFYEILRQKKSRGL